jgi:pilus assembly protein CpaC
MTTSNKIGRKTLLAASTMTILIASGPAFAAAPKRPAVRSSDNYVSAPVTQRASTEITLSKGRGQLVTLPVAISDVMVSNQDVADVQVRSPRQIYIYGKSSGESTVFATTTGGKVVYSANVRVGANVNSIDQMLNLAMPDADIKATTMNGLVLLTGTVASPEDSAEAERLAKAFVGNDIEVVNRTKTATPLQVNLQVKIAEVNRQFVKEVGVNLMSRDMTGGFKMGISQGRNFGTIGTQDLSSLPKLDASSIFGLPTGSLSLPFDPTSGQFITQGGTVYDLKSLGLGSGKTSLGLAGRLLGLDLASAIDLAENDGLATTLAQPTLTALSGETASFLAGGEIPVPLAGSLGQVSVEYKQYGVSLAFTPTVLSDGRISMRVRPEVSQLTSAGAVQLNGFLVPALSTRRVETTVELGSGQSFMIGGLMQNTQNNSIDRAPGLGNLPILGTLFRSNSFRKNETELVIVVTPYLVKPVSANEIKLPTDGYRAPNDFDRIVQGQTFKGKSGELPAKPRMGDPVTVPAPSVGAMMQPAPAPQKKSRKSAAADAPTPGFGN